MITFAGETEVARPREEVFDFLADLNNEPAFNPDASNIRKVTDGPIGRGTVYEEDSRRIGGYQMEPKGPLRLLTPMFRAGGKRMFEKKRAPGLKRALEGAS